MRGQAVHVAGAESGVVERGQDRAAGQGERADAGVPGEGRVAHAGHGRTIPEFKQALGHIVTLGGKFTTCQRVAHSA